MLEETLEMMDKYRSCIENCRWCMDELGKDSPHYDTLATSHNYLMEAFANVCSAFKMYAEYKRGEDGDIANG